MEGKIFTDNETGKTFRVWVVLEASHLGGHVSVEYKMKNGNFNRHTYRILLKDFNRKLENGTIVEVKQPA